MTKDELEKEAEEYAEEMANDYGSTYLDSTPSQFEKYLRNAYLSIVKSREKRIAELEKENAELKKEVLEVRQHLDLTEREWGKDTNKLIHFKTELTKAKNLIRRLINACCSYGATGRTTAEAEQFLKEVDK